MADFEPFTRNMTRR